MAGDGEQVRVAILGGGMAALAAALELTSRDDAERYQITLYQLGWRLGGKCASGRNADQHGRIEEHGLHVWFGCYHHAFTLLRRCYQALGLELEAAFTPVDDTPYVEEVDGEWRIWPNHFDRRPGRMGEAVPQDATDYVGWLLGFGQESTFAFADLVARSAPQPPVPPPEQEAEEEAPQSPAEAYAARLQAHSTEYRAFMEPLLHPTVPAPPSDSTAAEIRDRTTRFRAEVFAGLELAGFGDELRRLAIKIDLATTAAAGMLADGVGPGGRDWDAIDAFDAREWFLRHGADLATLRSAPVRALYDLWFAYQDGRAVEDSACFAAGVALNTTLRILRDYPASVLYLMRGGMGDVVAAPIYEVLRARGVRFRFFHRVERLELSADGDRVEKVHFTIQAHPHGEDYDALVRPDNGPAFWPGEPLYDRLEEGEALRNVALESRWAVKHGEPAHISAGEHFDEVLLGISVEELKTICGDLAERQPHWADLLAKLRTVQTMSVQLWTTRTTLQLGWQQGVVPTDAAPEPLDVWADRTEVLPLESWSGTPPRGLQYLCGPFPSLTTADHPTKDAGLPDMARREVRRITVEWLSRSARALWPNAVDGDGFAWGVLHDPQNREGEARLDAQYLRTNIDPTERYVLSLPGTTKYRPTADGSGFDNLTLTGDWTRTDWNAGCVEAAVISGENAARAIARKYAV